MSWFGNWFGGSSGSSTLGGAVIDITNGALGRWDPIVARVRIDAGSLQIAYSSGGLKFWLYDEDSGFSANFADRSSVVVDGDELVVTVLPNGGWWTDQVRLKFFAGIELDLE